jgi:hypothetical protein
MLLPFNIVNDVQKEVSGKTLHDIVQFFWYWKSTANYKQWKKKDRISIEGAAHFRLDHAIALKVRDLIASSNFVSKLQMVQKFHVTHACEKDLE